METLESGNILIPLTRYQNLLICEQFIDNMLNDIRDSESMVGPNICHYNSVPAADASTKEKADWLKLYMNACRKTLLESHRLKKNEFGKSSEKAVKNNKKINNKDNKEDKNNCQDKKRYK